MNENDTITFKTQCPTKIADEILCDMHKTFRKNHPEYTDEDIARLNKMAEEKPMTAPRFVVCAID